MEDREAYFNKLVETHDKIKNHKFREIFCDNTMLGTWKVNFGEYLDLIKEAAGCLSSIDFIDKSNLLCSYWYHDLSSTFLRLKDIYINDSSYDKHKNTIIPDINITIEEFYRRLGFLDINKVMIWLDALIQDLHYYIEFRELPRITGICETRVHTPHNGYYYRWMATYTKENGNFKATFYPDIMKQMEEFIKKKS